MESIVPFIVLAVFGGVGFFLYNTYSNGKPILYKNSARVAIARNKERYEAEQIFFTIIAEIVNSSRKYDNRDVELVLSYTRNQFGPSPSESWRQSFLKGSLRGSYTINDYCPFAKSMRILKRMVILYAVFKYVEMHEPYNQTHDKIIQHASKRMGIPLADYQSLRAIFDVNPNEIENMTLEQAYRILAMVPNMSNEEITLEHQAFIEKYKSICYENPNDNIFEHSIYEIIEMNQRAYEIVKRHRDIY